MTTPAVDELHRDILKAREEQVKLNQSQFSDWDDAKKRVLNRAASERARRSRSTQ